MAENNIGDFISLNIIPDFGVYFAVTKRDAPNSCGDIGKNREAYNKAIEIKTIFSNYDCHIILPKLIEDKIKRNLSDVQKRYFYPMVKRDNSTSIDAGLNHETCIATTAKNLSYTGHTIILHAKNVSRNEIISENKKIKCFSPDKFIEICNKANDFFSNNGESRTLPVFKSLIFAGFYEIKKSC